MNTPMNDLLPCPMCGKSVAVVTTSAEMWPDYDDDGCADSFAVMCDASAPNGPGGCGSSGGFHPTEAKAISAWNTRANTPESSAAQGAITDTERSAFFAQTRPGDPRDDATIHIWLLKRRVSDATAQPSGKETIADQINAAKVSNAEMPDWMKKTAHFATAQPINTDDMNDNVLRGLAALNEKEAGDLLTEMAENAPPRVDLTDEQIEAIWHGLDGKSIIAGESSLNWNKVLRLAFARALLANTNAQHSPAQGKPEHIADVGKMVQPTYTTGHCEHHKQPGGCQQHNLHCGWPKCDQRALAAKKG